LQNRSLIQEDGCGDEHGLEYGLEYGQEKMKIEEVGKDRTRRLLKMWLKTGQEDGGKGQERRWLKMWLKTGREMVAPVGKDRTGGRRCG
jgi:hypothetical protein